jgi:dihydrofolate reductase
MAEMFVFTQVSLDGYAADANDELEWTERPDDELDEMLAEQLRSIDAMIFGHNAYRLLAPYWRDGPTARAVDREHTRLMNSVPKLVLSRGEPELDWGPAKRIGEDLSAEIAELKAAEGRAIAVFAGPQAVAALLPYVDEVRLLVYPVLLGGGRPAFPGRAGQFRIVEARPFATSGAVQLRYWPVR